MPGDLTAGGTPSNLGKIGDAGATIAIYDTFCPDSPLSHSSCRCGSTWR